MSQSDYRDYLKQIWYDPQNPASYVGADKLYRVVKEEGKFKIGRRKIRQWLQDQDSYGLSRNIVRKFPRNRYVVDTVDSLWEMDLADVSDLKAENDNYKYLLFVIDVFSRFLWIQPLKDKTANNVIKALGVILSERKPQSIKSDKGSEFKNKYVQRYLSKQNIHAYYSQNETKSAIVERSIRTIKVALYRYFRHKQAYRYLDVIQKFVYDYNHRPHTSLGKFSPAEVNKINANEVRFDSYIIRQRKIKSEPRTSKTKKRKKYKFKIDDLVRITYVRHPFQRDYKQKWTEELFKIRGRYMRDGIHIYQLKDFDNENIDGTFYGPELQKVNKNKDTLWKIEKVLKKRKRRGVEQVLVRWLGWPKKFDSWINASDIE